MLATAIVGGTNREMGEVECFVPACSSSRREVDHYRLPDSVLPRVMAGDCLRASVLGRITDTPRPVAVRAEIDLYAQGIAAVSANAPPKVSQC